MGCPKCDWNRYYSKASCVRTVMERYNAGVAVKAVVYGIAILFALLALSAVFGYS